jgi:hypothetical protein
MATGRKLYFAAHGRYFYGEFHYKGFSGKRNKKQREPYFRALKKKIRRLALMIQDED